MIARGARLVLVGCLLGAIAGPVRAQARLTQDEVLALAFPNAASIDRKTAFLSEVERKRAERAAGEGARVAQNVVTFYLAVDVRGAPIGVAYFDAHIVRTLDEVLMIVVGLDDAIRRIDVVRFSEPPEYEASDRWLETIVGKSLNEELSLKGDVVNITGASLTARAVVRASRRALALHAVIEPFAEAR